MKRILFCVMIVFSVLEASAYKKESIDIKVNGKTRNMVVFTPNELPAKSPLFIVTHGMNQDPEYQYGSDKMYEMIDTAKFVITYLRSDGSTWDTGGTKDQNFVIKTIDEMAERYDIDRDRVYWSGFSMGSMLIHHCIANMQDKIAAFAPTSGIQFSESPWNNCKKPVNLLECIAYGDDVFGYEQYGIHDYIEKYAKHDNHTCYSKEVGYRAKSGNWQDGDLEKWTGGVNGGEVWLYSFNNGGHWPSDQNRFLIWNFCKRFSLNMPKVRFTQPAIEETHLFMGPTDEASFPDITAEATADAVEGSHIVKVDFYDGNTLIASKTETPYSITLPAAESGKHYLRVVATDDKGKTADAFRLVNNEVSTKSYKLSQKFNANGIVPQGWSVSSGTKTRVGGGISFTNGPRMLYFSKSASTYKYGLLVQNSAGEEKAAWAKFCDKDSRSSLTLHYGLYELKYKVCNWKQPEFSPVTVVIETLDGEKVASQTYTPTVNIGGTTDKKVSGVDTQTFDFVIPETGNYVITFYTSGEKNADFVLMQATLQAKDFTSDISRTYDQKAIISSHIYDLNGRRLSKENLKSGVYIIDGKKVIVR